MAWASARDALLAVVALLGALRLAAGVAAWRAANALEQPAYTTLKRLPGGVEIREYKPYTIAEAAVRARTMREGSAEGFRSCAGYIFGKNRARGLPGKGAVKMAMTSPVRMVQKSPPDSVKMAMTSPVRMHTDGELVKVSFVVPSKYTRQTAPTPEDKAVVLREVAPHKLAVRTFSGPPPSESRVTSERAKLVAALQKAGVALASGADGAETLVYGATLPALCPLGWSLSHEIRGPRVCLLDEGATDHSQLQGDESPLTTTSLPFRLSRPIHHTGLPAAKRSGCSSD